MRTLTLVALASAGFAGRLSAQVATLDESFDRYLAQEAEIPGGVDVEALERLASKALELVKKFKKAQQSNPQ